MSGRMREMGVTLCGLVTSVLTALLLWIVEWQFDFGIYTLSVLFVIPIGAIVSGCAAASGYYLGAVWLEVRPGWSLLVSMVAISTACFFLIYHLSYTSLEITHEGKTYRVAEVIAFSDFLDGSIRNMTLGRVSDNNADKAALGSWGYLFAVLQILGFALGGGAVWFFLRSKMYCESCSRYLKRFSRQNHFVRTGEEIDERMQALTEGSIRQWEQHVEGLGQPKAQKGLHYDLQVTDMRCPACDLRAVSLEGRVRQGNDWKTTFLTTDTWHTDEPVDEPATASPGDDTGLT